MIPGFRPHHALVLAAALVSCSPGSGPGEAGPGVLVVAIDGLRADHLSCFGHDRPTTPAMDALAKEGVVFTQTISAAPLTLPAAVSLLTGCDPNVARRRYLKDEYAAAVEQRWRIPEKVPHLAVELLKNGYATAAFVDHDHLAAAYGFDPGFQSYVVSDTSYPRLPHKAGAPAVTGRFLQWLRSLDRSRPWFAFVHFNDLERSWSLADPLWESYFSPRPEGSWIPPVGNTDSVLFAIPRSRWRGGAHTLAEYEARYDGHLRKLDGELANLLDSLRVIDRYRNTTIVVVGTHGVQFGEAGMILTSGRYSVADLHVPWILRWPNLEAQLAQGRRIEHLASLLDVAPTLLDILGMAVPAGTHGRSQASLVRDADAPPVREFAFASCGVQAAGAVFGQRWVLEYIHAGALTGHREGVLGDVALRRSWFGDGLKHEGQWIERYYDRSVNPYPPLWAGSGSLPENAQEMRNAASSWDYHIQNARMALQPGTLVHDRAQSEVVAELKALGFLGDDV